MKTNKQRLKVIDFFCSGGGMSFGLQQSGIDVIAGIDIDPRCRATYELNIRGSKYILADIEKLRAVDLSKEVPVGKDDDNLVFVGCSPCQYWTIIRTNKTKARRSKNLLHEFGRFVKHYNPGYVIVENVPGILSKHKESGLDRFVRDLEHRGYIIDYGVVSLNDYGVPETRKRFSLIANRVTGNKIFPEPDHSRPVVADFIGPENGFEKIPAGHRDETNFMHTTAALTERNLKRLALTPLNGGTRQSWANTDLQIDAYKNQVRKNSFSDTYGRMSWGKPAPQLQQGF